LEEELNEDDAQTTWNAKFQEDWTNVSPSKKKYVKLPA